MRLPVLEGLLPVERSRVRADVLAGLTLAALGVPEVLGYAKIAGMPLVTGLYTLLLPMAVFAVLGSSRHLVVAADSATAAILAAALAGLAVAGSPAYVKLAGLAALITAGMLLAARLARLAFLANFLSRTVLVGFLTGVGIQVAAGQLPDMLGVSAAGQSTVPRLLRTLRALPQAHWADVAIAVAVIVIVLVLRRITRQLPGPLIAVVAAIAVSKAADLAAHGVTVIGAVPRGLPDLTLPAFGWHNSAVLTGAAASMFVVILAQSAATSRAYAAKYEEEVSEATDLVGLGAANAAAAFAHGYPVAGGLSQSTVNDKAGARTPMSLVFASAAIAVCLLFLTDLLRNLPDVVLAAIVLVAVKGLVNVAELRRTFTLSRVEFWVAMVAFASVLLLGILKGVLLAALVSMVLLIRRAAVPPVSRLGRLPGTDRFADHAHNPEAQDVPGTLIVRVEAALLYFNAGHVRDEVQRLVAEAGEGLRVVVWDLSTSPYVDIAGVRMLQDVARELAARGIEVRVAEAHLTVRELLRKEGDAALSLPAGRVTVAEAVAA